MSKQKIISILKKLVGHDYIEIVTRGNSAIDSALGVVKGKLLIPEEGGWIHYKKAPVKLGLEIVEVKCNDAKIDLKDLEEKSKDCSAFLYHNPGGYFAEQPLREIYEICQKNNCLVILDVAGGIGTKLCDGKYADIVIGSFGKWKLVEAKVGGFISCENDQLWKKIKYEQLDNKDSLDKILEELEKLPERIKYLRKICDKIISDLDKFSIAYKNDFGFVVVVKFSDDSEKQTIINYCDKNQLPYTECPRYIRLNDKAISIEVKRL